MPTKFPFLQPQSQWSINRKATPNSRLNRRTKQRPDPELSLLLARTMAIYTTLPPRAKAMSNLTTQLSRMPRRKNKSRKPKLERFTPIPPGLSTGLGCTLERGPPIALIFTTSSNPRLSITSKCIV